LSHDGYSIEEIAQITRQSGETVRRWLHRFSSIVFKTTKFNWFHLAELKRSPLRLGYRTNVWTVELLADRLHQQYGCEISPHTLRRRMRALGLRCKRPRYVYSEKEPHLPQKKGRLSVN
jgi:transposase